MALYHKWEAFVCFACNTMLAYSKRPGKETNFNVTKFASDANIFKTDKRNWLWTIDEDLHCAEGEDKK